MLEVYLNVIEWGPDVYGIGEASSYYFDKHPGMLSLDESVFLASIVPSPKAFAWKFNDEGMLKDYAVKHNKHIEGLMLRRGLITEQDTIEQDGQVVVSGRGRSRININEAKLFLKDTAAVSTISFGLFLLYMKSRL